MIDSMFQEGTDKALDDQVARPTLRPPKVGFWTGFGSSAPRGIGAAAAEGIAFGAEITGAFGQVQGATGTESAGGMFSTQSPQERQQSEAARQKLTQGSGIDYSNEAGDIFRARARDIMPDPNTTGTAGQLTAGLTNFATKAIGYNIALGPMGAVALGGDVGMTEADRLKQEGVDLPTRTKAGAAAGALAGASVAVPLTGPTALYRFGVGTAVGVGSISGTSLAEREILRAARYDKIADTFDPLDPVALALGVVPGVLGARFGAPRVLKSVKTEAQLKDAAQFTPQEQAHEAAYESSPTNLASLEAAIKAEKRPEVRAELVAELDKQRGVAGRAGVEAAVQAEPDLVPAARVMQAADAIDAARLTPDEDIAGRDRHVSAVETAADQMGRGDDVAVTHLLSDADEQARLLAEFERLSKQPENDHGQPLARGTEPAAGAQAGREVVFSTLEGGTRSAGEFAGATRIRGADAQPLEVYRGAGRALSPDDFHPQALGFATKNPSSGLGVFFTPDRAEAARYGQVESAHLDIRNPKVIRADEMPGFDSLQQATAFREQLRAQGHDGIIMSAEHLGGGRNIIAFDAHQVARRTERPTAAARTIQLADSVDQLRSTRAAAEEDAPRASVAEPAAQGQDGAAKPPKEPPQGKGQGEPAAQPGQAGIERAAAEVAALDPDMLVHMDGMDGPMRVGDLLERVKTEAADDVKLGKLLEVAAACDLRA